MPRTDRGRIATACSKHPSWHPHRRATPRYPGFHGPSVGVKQVAEFEVRNQHARAMDCGPDSRSDGEGEDRALLALSCTSLDLGQRPASASFRRTMFSRSSA